MVEGRGTQRGRKTRRETGAGADAGARTEQNPRHSAAKENCPHGGNVPRQPRGDLRCELEALKKSRPRPITAETDNGDLRCELEALKKSRPRRSAADSVSGARSLSPLASALMDLLPGSAPEELADDLRGEFNALKMTKTLAASHGTAGDCSAPGSADRLDRPQPPSTSETRPPPEEVLEDIPSSCPQGTVTPTVPDAGQMSTDGMWVRREVWEASKKQAKSDLIELEQELMTIILAMEAAYGESPTPQWDQRGVGGWIRREVLEREVREVRSHAKHDLMELEKELMNVILSVETEMLRQQEAGAAETLADTQTYATDRSGALTQRDTLSFFHSSSPPPASEDTPGTPLARDAGSTATEVRAAQSVTANKLSLLQCSISTKKRRLETDCQPSQLQIDFRPSRHLSPLCPGVSSRNKAGGHSQAPMHLFPARVPPQPLAPTSLPGSRESTVSPTAGSPKPTDLDAARNAPREPGFWAAAAPLVRGLAHFHKRESPAAFHDAALDAGAGVAHTAQDDGDMQALLELRQVYADAAAAEEVDPVDRERLLRLQIIVDVLYLKTQLHMSAAAPAARHPALSPHRLASTSKSKVTQLEEDLMHVITSVERQIGPLSLPRPDQADGAATTAAVVQHAQLEHVQEASGDKGAEASANCLRLLRAELRDKDSLLESEKLETERLKQEILAMDEERRMFEAQLAAAEDAAVISAAVLSRKVHTAEEAMAGSTAEAAQAAAEANGAKEEAAFAVRSARQERKKMMDLSDALQRQVEDMRAHKCEFVRELLQRVECVQGEVATALSGTPRKNRQLAALREDVVRLTSERSALEEAWHIACVRVKSLEEDLAGLAEEVEASVQTRAALEQELEEADREIARVQEAKDKEVEEAVANSLEEMEALEQELLSTRRQLSDDLAQEQRERSRLAEQVQRLSASKDEAMAAAEAELTTLRQRASACAEEASCQAQVFAAERRELMEQAQAATALGTARGHEVESLKKQLALLNIDMEALGKETEALKQEQRKTTVAFSSAAQHNRTLAAQLADAQFASTSKLAANKLDIAHLEQRVEDEAAAAAKAAKAADAARAEAAAEHAKLAAALDKLDAQITQVMCSISTAGEATAQRLEEEHSAFARRAACDALRLEAEVEKMEALTQELRGEMSALETQMAGRLAVVKADKEAAEALSAEAAEREARMREALAVADALAQQRAEDAQKSEDASVQRLAEINTLSLRLADAAIASEASDSRVASLTAEVERLQDQLGEAEAARASAASALSHLGRVVEATAAPPRNSGAAGFSPASLALSLSPSPLRPVSNAAAAAEEDKERAVRLQEEVFRLESELAVERENGKLFPGDGAPVLAVHKVMRVNASALACARLMVSACRGHAQTSHEATAQAAAHPQRTLALYLAVTCACLSWFLASIPLLQPRVAGVVPQALGGGSLEAIHSNISLGIQSLQLSALEDAAGAPIQELEELKGEGRRRLGQEEQRLRERDRRHAKELLARDREWQWLPDCMLNNNSLAVPLIPPQDTQELEKRIESLSQRADEALALYSHEAREAEALKREVGAQRSALDEWRGAWVEVEHTVKSMERDLQRRVGEKGDMAKEGAVTEGRQHEDDATTRGVRLQQDLALIRSNGRRMQAEVEQLQRLMREQQMAHAAALAAERDRATIAQEEQASSQHARTQHLHQELQQKTASAQAQAQVAFSAAAGFRMLALTGLSAAAAAARDRERLLEAADETARVAQSEAAVLQDRVRLEAGRVAAAEGEVAALTALLQEESARGAAAAAAVADQLQACKQQGDQVRLMKAAAAKLHDEAQQRQKDLAAEASQEKRALERKLSEEYAALREAAEAEAERREGGLQAARLQVEEALQTCEQKLLADATGVHVGSGKTPHNVSEVLAPVTAGPKMEVPVAASPDTAKNSQPLPLGRKSDDLLEVLLRASDVRTAGIRREVPVSLCAEMPGDKRRCEGGVVQVLYNDKRVFGPHSGACVTPHAWKQCLASTRAGGEILDCWDSILKAKHAADPSTCVAVVSRDQLWSLVARSTPGRLVPSVTSSAASPVPLANGTTGALQQAGEMVRRAVGGLAGRGGLLAKAASLPSVAQSVRPKELLSQLVPPSVLSELDLSNLEHVSVVPSAGAGSGGGLPSSRPAPMACTDGFQCERWQLQSIVHLTVIDGHGTAHVLHEWLLADPVPPVEVRLPADAATGSPGGDMETGWDTMGRYGGNGARF